MSVGISLVLKILVNCKYDVKIKIYICIKQIDQGSIFDKSMFENVVLDYLISGRLSCVYINSAIKILYSILIKREFKYQTATFMDISSKNSLEYDIFKSKNSSITRAIDQFSIQKLSNSNNLHSLNSPCILVLTTLYLRPVT